MSAIVECVPNFSEGRNQETIDAIADAIRQTNDCHLLDVDPGPSTNRTVYTFVGNRESVVEGALNAARIAKERIDMTKHKGTKDKSRRFYLLFRSQGLILAWELSTSVLLFLSAE